MTFIFLAVLFTMLLVAFSPENEHQHQSLYNKLKEYILTVISEFDLIDDDRKKTLRSIAKYVNLKSNQGETAELIFICTHNSRRSHFAQVWAQTAAFYYDVQDVNTYSGGTESTAFNPNAVRALTSAGFRVDSDGDAINPVYSVHYAEDSPHMEAFSKKMDHPSNPQKNFCAVMTCSQADAECPFVPGCDLRVSLPYDDPKAFDGTAIEQEKYEERCRQIAREMFYMFSLV
ncbi:MAG: protein-tyrosine-phosphatase [candidate division KSB1 bacterium]|jgi:protein-tyrosine-phosphatase|nr:protein-tyrosine-phosphatase [candidate division KSB1 bacterium]